MIPLKRFLLKHLQATQHQTEYGQLYSVKRNRFHLVEKPTDIRKLDGEILSTCADSYLWEYSTFTIDILQAMEMEPTPELIEAGKQMVTLRQEGNLYTVITAIGEAKLYDKAVISLECHESKRNALLNVAITEAFKLGWRQLESEYSHPCSEETMFYVNPHL